MSTSLAQLVEPFSCFFQNRLIPPARRNLQLLFLEGLSQADMKIARLFIGQVIFFAEAREQEVHLSLDIVGWAEDHPIRFAVPHFYTLTIDRNPLVSHRPPAHGYFALPANHIGGDRPF